MDRTLDFLSVLLTQFAGGPAAKEDNLIRFGLAAVFWAMLLLIAWYRRRQQALPREKWLVWGFGLAFARELFMFGHIATQVMGIVAPDNGNQATEPLEHSIAVIALLVVTAAFLRYILQDIPLVRRYLQIGVTAVVISYLVTFRWWIAHIAIQPNTRFHQSWGGWLFHFVTLSLLITAIILLLKQRGWLRNTVILALSFFCLSELKIMVNFVTGGQFQYLICPLGNSFHIAAIPILGFVYIRELFIERNQAEDALIAYRNHLEDLVEERTVDLTKTNSLLQLEISERSRVENALRESDARFRRVITSISDHIYMTEITADGQRLNRYISPNIQNLTGHRPEKFLNDWNFWPSAVIHADDQAMATAHALHLTLGRMDEIEYRLVRANGDIIWVRDSARIEKFGDSQIVYGVVSDITERKAAEQKLEQLSRHNTMILDSAGEGIFGVAIDGCHTFVNPAAARMLGYKPHELIGRPSHTTWHHTKVDGTPYPETDCPLHNGYKNGQICRGDNEIFWRKDGTNFPVRYTSTPIFEHNQLKGAVVVFQDITQRKQAQAELSRRTAQVATLKERQRIAADMHDGLAQTLSYLGYQIDEVADLTGNNGNSDLLRQHHRIRQIIDQASRDVRHSIASLQEEPQPRRSLQTHLKNIISQLNANGGPPVTLHTTLTADMFLPSGHIEQVNRVVQEGLLNALNHARANHITVDLHQTDGDIHIAIEDNGQGFDPNQPPADNRDHFGLKIMRARAARIDGRVTIDSSPGHGTKLLLSWPASAVSFSNPPEEGPEKISEPLIIN